MGKGGVGKTTVAASIGSVFAELRPGRPRGGDRRRYRVREARQPRRPPGAGLLLGVGGRPASGDVRRRAQSGGEQLGRLVRPGRRGDASTPPGTRSGDLPGGPPRGSTGISPMSIVDCSSTMDTPVTQEVLRDLDALVVVSSPWVDGAAAAGQTMDWLAARGLTGLLQRTVIVLNDSDGHADTRTRFDSGATVFESGPGGRRGALRRASATGRRHRPSRASVAFPRGVASSRSRPHSPSTSLRAMTATGSVTERCVALSSSWLDQRFDSRTACRRHRLPLLQQQVMSSSETPAAWAVSRIVRLAPRRAAYSRCPTVAPRRTRGPQHDFVVAGCAPHSAP